MSVSHSALWLRSLFFCCARNHTRVTSFLFPSLLHTRSLKRIQLSFYTGRIFNITSQKCQQMDIKQDSFVETLYVRERKYGCILYMNSWLSCMIFIVKFLSCFVKLLNTMYARKCEQYKYNFLYKLGKNYSQKNIKNKRTFWFATYFR